MRIWPFARSADHERRLTDRTGRGNYPRSRWWLPGVAGGLVVVLLIMLLPAGSAAWNVTFLGGSLLSLVILFGAALAMPRGVRVVWWSLFAFQSLAVSAQALSDYQMRAEAGASFLPGADDLLSLLAYVALFMATSILIVRLSPGRGRDALIDASILSVAAGSMFALFLAVPLLDSSGTRHAHRRRRPALPRPRLSPSSRPSSGCSSAAVGHVRPCSCSSCRSP